MLLKRFIVKSTRKEEGSDFDVSMYVCKGDDDKVKFHSSLKEAQAEADIHNEAFPESKFHWEAATIWEIVEKEKEPEKWACCGGIELTYEEKCPVCGDKY